ncbi:hypothetical protein GWK47_050383 [Chionoecetes opilio]|uniref:Uncharacterized protein n=1 Tax=Chionoecetes opilio TaxID=41210 RepID=A0A8J4YA38_CHIOP|nr:hypothetical protein GWK47_050383 [Chionoecetes opilio]
MEGAGEGTAYSRAGGCGTPSLSHPGYTLAAHACLCLASSHAICGTPLAHTGTRVTHYGAHSSRTHRFHATRGYAHARPGVACAFHGDAHGHPHTFSARRHARRLPWPNDEYSRPPVRTV